MSINGVIFPNYRIEYNKYPEVLRSILVWIMHDEFLKSFVKVDAEVTFEVLYKLFDGEPNLVLMDYDKDLMNYFVGDKNIEKFTA